LTYLKRFPFDNLKVDRTLVSDVADAEPTGRAILSSVVGLARALSLGVVAEGVETQEQLDQVVELGADMAQGYLLSRPLLPAAFEREVLDLAGPRDTIYLPAPVTAAAT
jgi:EAL domain-containing protein (putative c-di-GMP-specific phosphodiesterase class I)